MEKINLHLNRCCKIKSNDTSNVSGHRNSNATLYNELLGILSLHEIIHVKRFLLGKNSGPSFPHTLQFHFPPCDCQVAAWGCIWSPLSHLKNGSAGKALG